MKTEHKQSFKALHNECERKASDWLEAEPTYIFERELVAIKTLPVYDFSNVESPLDFFEDEKPQYFIAQRGERKYFVDTQGYNYCRYILGLDID